VQPFTASVQHDRTLRAAITLVLALLATLSLIAAAVGFLLAYAAFFPTGQTPVGPWAAVGPAIGSFVLFVAAGLLFPWPKKVT